MMREEREQAIAILENEKKCVNRANKNDYCNRDCYNCELVKTDTEILTALDMAIQALEQELKTGYWEHIRCDMYECSECQHIYTDLSGEKQGMNFCPNCGCRMIEPQERSDKE